jgi:hypothetical protein
MSVEETPDPKPVEMPDPNAPGQPVTPAEPDTERGNGNGNGDEQRDDDDGDGADE